MVHIYEIISYQELIQEIQKSGFDLPGEDEWEYLCGGGSRTLWRWGNSFDYKMKIPFITSEEPTTWDIEWPNQFGLKIAFNPYLQEIINDKDTLLKGGDGGCNLCGGANIALGFLPVATYYKGYNKHTDELDYINDIGGNYTSYRRIIRL
ncbi:SUMF1/EgtB/PvdO family nonheme iron enzyme [Escherichia albertii]|uniref:SUMF1/EgtB/PvdO family nonheme iron enzyme n=1 Tax=Escherichia albertii TaxID=208962 RepID=UPI001CB8B78E|nr:SUMF1/EgtB/PvdO family nonheme iron enzyme [Escherichia albertii]MCU7337464.1 formylglycine-generating enzyme family protein [Escherichia albertii]MCU7341596.1 formylglycine-generating enzyme family protein [Escherichia albertii]WAR40342.1 formylglycine-generating enzyme family protein [Escherichia albertii]